jgi:hypothetical protein
MDKDGHWMLSDTNTDHLDTMDANLHAALDVTASASGLVWLKQALETVVASERIEEDLGLYSAMAKRKLGTARLQHAQVIDTTFSPLDIQRWSAAEAGRLVLLIGAVKHHPDMTESLIRTYYRMGDESERIALVRGLIFFAPGVYLTELALDAGRTNSLNILAALILDNPYPASFFSTQAFNQMVLKGLFLGLAIERVVGIEQRANTDLSRMCENYVVEREVAGRTVPEDIWLAIAPFASEQGRGQMIKYLDNEAIGHRYYCTLSLCQQLSKDPSLKSLLEEHLRIEKNTMIRKLLQDTLQPGANSQQ